MRILDGQRYKRPARHGTDQFAALDATYGKRRGIRGLAARGTPASIKHGRSADRMGIQGADGNSRTLYRVPDEPAEGETMNTKLTVIEHETRTHETDGIEVTEAVDRPRLTLVPDNRDLEWLMRETASTPYADIRA